MKIPEKGLYYHYKHTADSINNYAYEVVGIARHSEESDFLVLYRPLYESEWMPPADLQARPLEMFFENVLKDGKSIQRFQKITDPEIIEKLEKIKSEMYKD